MKAYNHTQGQRGLMVADAIKLLNVGREAMGSIKELSRAVNRIHAELLHPSCSERNST